MTNNEVISKILEIKSEVASDESIASEEKQKVIDERTFSVYEIAGYSNSRNGFDVPFEVLTATF